MGSPLPSTFDHDRAVALLTDLIDRHGLPFVETATREALAAQITASDRAVDEIRQRLLASRAA